MPVNTDPLRLGEMADGVRIALRAAGHDILRYKQALFGAGVTGRAASLGTAFDRVQDAIRSFEFAQEIASTKLAQMLHDELPEHAKDVAP